MTDTPAKPLNRMWSQADAATAAELWQLHFADHYGDDDGPKGARYRVFQRIAASVNRSFWSVEQRFLAQGPSFGANQRSPGRVSPHALAARDARKEAENRQHPASRLLGDPPPGFSALDRKNNGVTR